MDFTFPYDETCGNREYAFARGIKVKWFGPYENEDQAKSAFQRVYGYWPDDAVDTRPYTV